MDNNVFGKKTRPRNDRFIAPRSSLEALSRQGPMQQCWDDMAKSNSTDIWDIKYVKKKEYAEYINKEFGWQPPAPRTKGPKNWAKRQDSSYLQSWPCIPRQKRFLSSADSVLDLPTYRFSLFPDLLDWNTDDVLVAALGQQYYKWSWRNQGLVHRGVTEFPVLCCKFDPKGELLALGTEYQRVEIHHHATNKRVAIGKCACILDTADVCNITAVDWSPTGDHFVTGCSRGYLSTFSRSHASIVGNTRAGYRTIISVRLSPDSRFVAVTSLGAQTATVLCWPSFSERNRLKCDCTVKTMAWHPWRSALLAIGVVNRFQHCAVIALWDAHKKEIRHFYTSPVNYNIELMLFSHLTGEMVLSLWNPERQTSEYDKTSRLVVLSDPETVVDQWGEDRHLLDRIRTMVFSPDGTKLATATMDEDLIIWNFLPETEDTKKSNKYQRNKFATIPACLNETKFDTSFVWQ